MLRAHGQIAISGGDNRLQTGPVLGLPAKDLTAEAA